MSHPAPKSDEKVGPTDYLYAIVFLALFIGILASWVWSVAPNAIRYPAYYSVRYQIPYRQVLVDKKPTDCDWWLTPIGDKGCHYEKLVSVQPKNGRPVSLVHIVWFKMQN